MTGARDTRWILWHFTPPYLYSFPVGAKWTFFGCLAFYQAFRMLGAHCPDFFLFCRFNKPFQLLCCWFLLSYIFWEYFWGSRRERTGWSCQRITFHRQGILYGKWKCRTAGCRSGIVYQTGAWKWRIPRRDGKLILSATLRRYPQTTNRNREDDTAWDIMMGDDSDMRQGWPGLRRWDYYDVSYDR